MSLTNRAVLACATAYEQTFAIERGKGTPTKAAEQKARQDYFQSMPDLAEPENISDYVSCVSYAMLRDMIDDKVASKLLYSAQIASGAFRRPRGY
jgi:hypothetical protein